MTPNRRLALAALVPGVVLAGWMGLGGLMLRSSLDPGTRAALAPLAASHGALLVGWWAAAAVLGGWAVVALHRRLVAPVQRMAGATRLLAGDGAAPDLVPQGGGAARALAGSVNALAAERRRLQADMAELVEEASRATAEERDQLGALMAELEQSVVVCTLDGRILLYNDRARTLFRRLSPTRAGGAEAIGLGRSIHGLVDEAQLAHAREAVERRIARGDARVSSGFVTAAPGGRLVQVSVAPVRSGEARRLTGFVLLLDDVTDDVAVHARRDQHLLALSEAARASLASMGAALDVLDCPELEAAERQRFQDVVHEEVDRLSQRLAKLAEEAADDLATRWPLHEMRGTDLLAAVAARIEAATGRVPGREEADPDLWLRVDSFALSEALACLAGRVPSGAGPALRLAREGGWARLDLAWSSDAGDAVPVGWQAMAVGSGMAQSVAEVAERHGGTVWFGRDEAAGRAFFRFLLPAASGEGEEAAAADRPIYYDFDLLTRASGAEGLDDCALEALACTVFDCETTGLDPAGGDEIIQLGAVRLLNGRLLAGERFDQLVDPGRSIPEASIPFHGIRPEMVRGQPRIGEVLAAFHAFADDTVLVGHNVAFDMRFLQLKEAVTGLRFDQPVLDTLLLASVAQPGEGSYALEAIAARLGVPVSARHSAAGDALTTAGVFLKLLPLLRERGIGTLGAARAASVASPFARLRY